MAAVKETRTTLKKWEIAKKHVEGKAIPCAEAVKLKEAQAQKKLFLLL